MLTVGTKVRLVEQAEEVAYSPEVGSEGEVISVGSLVGVRWKGYHKGWPTPSKPDAKDCWAVEESKLEVIQVHRSISRKCMNEILSGHEGARQSSGSSNIGCPVAVFCEAMARELSLFLRACGNPVRNARIRNEHSRTSKKH